MSSNPMFSTTSTIKFEFANSIVTSIFLTVTNENHERCIYFQSSQLMFRGLSDLQQSSMYFHGFIFSPKYVTRLFSRMRYNT